MPNIASALKEEIARVARKVAKPESDGLRKEVAQQRSTVVALKRRMDALERLLTAVAKGGRGSARAVAEDGGEESQSERRRFSAKGFAKQRERLGISAAAMGQLLGVSALSVYKWESGKIRPRAKQVEKIASVRGLGKKEVAARLAQGGGPGAPVAGDTPAATPSAAESGKPASTSGSDQPVRGRRAAAKKPGAKKVVSNREGPKKAASTKAATKNVPSDMTPAKKTAAKRAALKKVASKKAAAKKAPTKKAAAKKISAKRAAKRAAA